MFAEHVLELNDARSLLVEIFRLFHALDYQSKKERILALMDAPKPGK